MTYAQFKAEWLGRRVDYDHVYYYQCVDLILQYIKECYGIPTGVWGNAIDYWYRPSSPLLKKFKKVSASTKAQPGWIAIYFGHTGNPYGHIAIVDTPGSTSDKVLEQNGATGGGTGTGGDAIRCARSIEKSRLAGYLAPITAATAPKPSGGTATVLRDAYVRKSPSTTAPLAGSMLLHKGNTFKYVAKVTGQSVAGNHVWYKSQFGHYVWSGNCKG